MEMLPVDYTTLRMGVEIILVMKKLKIYGILIILLFTVSNMFATIHPPANPDESDPGNPEYKVVNTGNDMIGYEIQGTPFRMKITVADGSDPHIVFKKEDVYGGGLVQTDIIDNIICLNTEIEDPDVVLVENLSLTSETVDALIVFETVNGAINLVIKTFDNGNNSWFPNQNYSNGINLGQGTNPNIDISGSGLFAITWEDNGNIMSITGICNYLGNYTFGPVVTIYDKSANQGLNASLPDVSVNYYGGASTYTDVVTYCFIEDKTKKLYVYQDDFNNLFGGVANITNLSIRHSFNSTDMLGIPRIATPDNDHGGAPYDEFDYTIVMGGVIDPQPGSMNYSILGFNKHFGTLSDYNYEYSSTPNIYEGKPVVAYAGDIIIVAWEIDAWGGNNFGLDGRDIIQHQLTYNGSFATAYYSRVNMDVTETQAIPSVAADYSYDVLYSFYDENDMNIRFKSSHCNNQNLRIGRQHDIIGIYPNPTTDILNVNTKEDASIQLFDINGRMVYQDFLAAGNHKLDVSSYGKGVYILRLNRMNDVQTQRVVIY